MITKMGASRMLVKNGNDGDGEARTMCETMLKQSAALESEGPTYNEVQMS